MRSDTLYSFVSNF